MNTISRWCSRDGGISGTESKSRPRRHRPPARGDLHASDRASAPIGNWVLDIDIRGFFDTLDHGWLVTFVEHRVADRRVVRLIQKWLNAGVLEDGTILWTGPRFLLNRSNHVADQEGRELPRQLLIEQNAHARSPPHERLRDPQGLLPRDRRKGVQELIKAMVACQVINSRRAALNASGSRSLVPARLAAERQCVGLA